MRFCCWCGRDLTHVDRFCSACGEELPSRAELPKRFSVILRGVVYARGRRRDTLLGVVDSKAAADALVAEYRATGWVVDVVEGTAPRSVHVPGALEGQS